MNADLVIAAEEGEKTKNFLIPNGTFFAELIIFLIVLGVIWFFVLPPILKVLKEREGIVARTASDSKAAADGFDAADSEYQGALREARNDATEIRDGARSKGNERIKAAKDEASTESSAALADATDTLQAAGARAASEAGADVPQLATQVASKVLGFDVSADAKLSSAAQQLAVGRGSANANSPERGNAATSSTGTVQ